MVGVEPTLPQGNTILSRARLPIPPHRPVPLTWCRGPDSNRHGSYLPQDFKSCASANSATPAGCWNTFLEAAPGFEPGIKVLQTSALPLGYAAVNMERKTGLEPATPTLARWCSTTELLPQNWLG
jgi:hypothetical protein